jgi:hypothetical protein
MSKEEGSVYRSSLSLEKLLKKNSLASKRASEASSALITNFIPLMKEGGLPEPVSSYMQKVMVFGSENVKGDNFVKSPEIDNSGLKKSNLTFADLESYLHFDKTRPYPGSVYLAKANVIMLSEKFNVTNIIDLILYLHELTHAYDASLEVTTKKEKSEKQSEPTDLAYEIRAHATHIEAFNMIFPELKEKLAKGEKLQGNKDLEQKLFSLIVRNKVSDTQEKFYRTVIADMLFYTERYMPERVDSSGEVSDQFAHLIFKIYFKIYSNSDFFPIDFGYRDENGRLIKLSEDNFREALPRLKKVF